MTITCQRQLTQQGPTTTTSNNRDGKQNTSKIVTEK